MIYCNALTNYTNSVLVNNLITSPVKNVNSIVPDYLSAGSYEYKDVLEDYAEISQDAIDAYYADVASGALNSQFMSDNLVYDSMTTDKNPSGITNILSPELMLGYITY